jgi:predicted Rossmann fold nucleotide-binding protein DprA/Smf involved in DNA uptake
MGSEPRRGLAEVMRDEMVMKDKIVASLREKPQTIPEIAAALKCPSHEVLLWVMALWRYGSVAEVEKKRTEAYFRYRLNPEQ